MDKLFKFIASVALGVGIFQIPIAIILGPASLATYSIATILSALGSGTVFYAIEERICKKYEDAERKRVICVNQSLKGLYEIENSANSKVTQETSVFYKQILPILDENYLELEAEEICNINDLIYLVNANYYDEIAVNSELERENVIERITLQVALYLKEKEKKTITNKDIKNIINNCFFIKDSVKRKIIKEFKDSEVKFGSSVQHGIENRKILQQEDTKKINTRKASLDFDVENIEHYKILIEGLTAKDTYLREYGNIDNIEWDYEALKNVFSIMIKEFQQDLIKLNIEGGYSVFNIAGSYFYNIMCYAVMNQKAVVDYQSMLATFKDWEYLPYKLKIEMATAIIKGLDLNNVKHPYLQKVGPPKKTKIIEFPTNKRK